MTPVDAVPTPPAEEDERHRLLLLSADWQTRAMILAELKERGYGVLALPSFRLGLKAILRDYVDPPLVLVDTKDDPDLTPDEIRHLRELLPDTPIILLTGAFQRHEYESVRDQVDEFLVRPISVGEIVATVERRLPRRPGSTVGEQSTLP